jgi:carbonic anhydrase
LRALLYQQSGDCGVADLEFKTVNNGVVGSFPSSGCTANTVQIPEVDGTYQALQYHIHTESEHSIDGKFFDFEFHIVHSLVEGSGTGAGPEGRTNGFAVVGMVLQNGGPKNKMFDMLLKAWKSHQDEVLGSEACQNSGRRQLSESSKEHIRKLQEDFDVYGLLTSEEFYTYSGGLTTPPCSEAVWWNLNTEPVVISDEQGALLRQIILDYRDPDTCDEATLADPVTGTTSRAPQALNTREVKLYCPAADDTSVIVSLQLSLGLGLP